MTDEFIFTSLAVVIGDDGYVYKFTKQSPLLGPLRGARAQLGEVTTRHSILLPLILVPFTLGLSLLLMLPKAVRGQVLIVFADGTVHRRQFEGRNRLLTETEADVAQFNALAARTQPTAPH